MPDHINILIGLRPSQSISNLIKDVKQSSSKWINENKLVNGHFERQEGYGAFSHNKSQINKVIN
jgi:REP element-mobilizing transposase RayT